MLRASKFLELASGSVSLSDRGSRTVWFDIYSTLSPELNLLNS